MLGTITQKEKLQECLTHLWSAKKRRMAIDNENKLVDVAQRGIETKLWLPPECGEE